MKQRKCMEKIYVFCGRGEEEIKVLIIVFKLNFVFVQILSSPPLPLIFPHSLRARDFDGIRREADLLE